jgi:3-oxoacyl-[acyl-carrier-protein] synthase II
VVFTGQGAVCALGLGVDALWTELAAGRDGIRPIERFSTAAFTTHLGGMVPVPGTLGEDDAPGTNALLFDFALRAAREALAMAALPPLPPGRLALVLGSSRGSHLRGLHEVSHELATALGITGPALTISTACSSSTNALGFARDLLDQGLADVVLAGGADVLTPEVFAGFHALGLLSAQKCAPFSEPSGTTLGEGAGFLVLERADAASARGARTIACLTGYSLSADGYHATSPEPSGAGIARALRGTLEDAGLAAEDIGYVNAHGTGTEANDPAEWQALSQVFGPRVQQLAVSSTKSYFAHAQGSAGVLELISTLLAMEHRQALPTLHFTKARRRGPVDPVAEGRPRPLDFEHALSTNSAFGGANAAVAVSRQVRPRRPLASREVFVSGLSALGPFGQSVEALLAKADSRERRMPPFRLESVVPTADTRGMDPAARALTAAVALALADAKLKLTGPMRERTGLFVGTTNASPLAWEEFRNSIKERGLGRASAPAFTRLVLNGSCGTASRLLGLRGPTTAVTCGTGSGLLATVLAAIHLASRTDVDRMVVGAVDEVELERHSGTDAAAALVLTTAREESHVRLSGWAVAGPQSLDAAIASACAAAGVANLPASGPHHDAVASGSLLSCAGAVHALRLAPGRTLITDVSTVASCAVVFERSDA